VEGTLSDIVSNVGPVHKLGSSLIILQQWKNMVLPFESDRDLDASALSMDTLFAYPPYAGPNAFRIFYSSWWRQEIGEENPVERKRAEATIFQDQVTKASNGRAFFGTVKGYVGFGPAEVQTGDKIAILLGGSVPFVLGEQEGPYNLARGCYVLGLMNGEAFLGC
jgi:hypothetical protein